MANSMLGKLVNVLTGANSNDDEDCCCGVEIEEVETDE